MPSLLPWLSGLLVVSSIAANGYGATGAQPRDLHFGEALYHAYQGDHFDAITRLDYELGQYYGVDESDLDSLNFHINDAEFSIGDFELSYRMHKRAGRAITAVIEGNVEPSVRNEALYRLARIQFQKGRPEEALDALERISGEIPEQIGADVAFLRAQASMASGRPTDAVAILKGLLDVKHLEGFARYNLGIALLQAGRLDEGHSHLDRAGQITGDDRTIRAIRDKSNLTLGSRMLADRDYESAGRYLNRVRLEGPSSNRALLSLGWAEAELGRYDRALVPWALLAQRNATDKAVQEALLALPYAYRKLNVYGKAALVYGTAMEAFTQELAKLDASIHSIREGRFLDVLTREELKQDSNWVIKLRELPQTPETWYLTELIASHDFQESLKNYLDLEELRKRLSLWADHLDAYADLIACRRAYYEPLLPEIDRRFRALDSRIRLRLQQRDRLQRRLQSMLVAARPDQLATAEEREMLARLTQIEKRNGGDPDAGRRIDLLRGVVHWRVHLEYHERLTQVYAHLRQLEQEIAKMEDVYDAFVRTRQEVTQSYQGYEDSIRLLKARAAEAHERVAALMERQGGLIEAMAVEELDYRRRRLEEYQVQARFAMADSYDRAIRTPDAGQFGK